MHDMRAFVCIKGYFVRLTKMKGCLVSFEILKKSLQKLVQNQFPLALLFSDFWRQRAPLVFTRNSANTLQYFAKRYV